MSKIIQTIYYYFIFTVEEVEKDVFQMDKIIICPTTPQMYDATYNSYEIDVLGKLKKDILEKEDERIKKVLGNMYNEKHKKNLIKVAYWPYKIM